MGYLRYQLVIAGIVPINVQYYSHNLEFLIFHNLNLRYLLGRIPYINHHFTVWFDEVAISWHRIIGGLNQLLQNCG